MKKQFTVLFDKFSLWPVLLIGVLVWSCANNVNEKPGGQDSTILLKAAGPEQATVLKCLKLTQQQYNNLKPQHGHQPTALVVQFYYPSSYTSSESPKLIAYAMKKHEKTPVEKKEILDYATDRCSSSEPIYGREQILGDQDITFDELEGLIPHSSGGCAVDFSHFLFTPEQDADKHIRYKVTIVSPSLAPTFKAKNLPKAKKKKDCLLIPAPVTAAFTNPSPPASAR